MLGYRSKSEKETEQRKVLEVTEKEDAGICPPSMKTEVAFYYLCKYLLGEDWYCVSPMHLEQVNTVIVSEVVAKYARCKPAFK